MTPILPRCAAVTPLMIAALVLAGPSFARSYVCVSVSLGGACTQYVETIQSLATLDGLGITSEVLTIVVAFGLGAVMLFFAMGLGLGSIHRVLSIALGGASK